MLEADEAAADPTRVRVDAFVSTLSLSVALLPATVAQDSSRELFIVPFLLVTLYAVW
jgi:hypothetical protein